MLRKGTIHLATREGVGEVVLPCELIGEWAIHKNTILPPFPKRDGWRVSHLKTGLALPMKFGISKAQALFAARMLHRSVPPWNGRTKGSVQFRKAAKGAVNELRGLGVIE